MRQGDLYWANLSPTQGSEQKGHRPVVILSGDALNKHLDLCIVRPLTTKVKFYPGSFTLFPNSQNGLELKSQVLTFQIRAISKSRLNEKIGMIKKSQVADIKRGLFNVLTF